MVDKKRRKRKPEHVWLHFHIKMFGDRKEDTLNILFKNCANLRICCLQRSLSLDQRIYWISIKDLFSFVYHRAFSLCNEKRQFTKHEKAKRKTPKKKCVIWRRIDLFIKTNISRRHLRDPMLYLIHWIWYFQSGRTYVGNQSHTAHDRTNAMYALIIYSIDFCFVMFEV